MTAFYNTCLTTGTCDGSGLSTPACFACLLSQPTSPTWGVVIDYTSSFSLNLGGCYALTGATASCAAYAEEQDECEVAACVGSCSTAASTAFDTCITTADSGECQTYVAGVTAACPAAITGAAACGGTQATLELAYEAIAATFCE